MDEGSRAASPWRVERPLLTIEPFLGWRSWVVVPGSQAEPVLRGLAGVTWPGPQLAAECLPSLRVTGPWASHDSSAPEVRCSCGIYATPEPSRRWEWGSSEHRVRAVGWVELSGRVVEHTFGLRGQRATVVGPLSLQLGRCTCLRLATALRPSRHVPRGVIEGDGRYLLTCDQRRGTPLPAWADAVSRALEKRYRVQVTGPRKEPSMNIGQPERLWEVEPLPATAPVEEPADLEEQEVPVVVPALSPAT